MKSNDRPAPRNDRRDSRKPAPRAWAKPDFVELSACAEIGAYIFTA